MKLRALEPEDIDNFYRIENNEIEWGVSNTTVPFSRYAIREYIVNNSYDIYKDKQLRQVIVTDDNIFIGFIDIVNFEPRHNRAEISIVIAPEHRRMSYATLAVKKIICYAREFLGLSILYAIIPESNKPSIRLFEKVGFSHTATLKEWLTSDVERENAMVYQFFLKKK